MPLFSISLLGEKVEECYSFFLISYNFPYLKFLQILCNRDRVTRALDRCYNAFTGWGWEPGTQVGTPLRFIGTLTGYASEGRWNQEQS